MPTPLTPSPRISVIAAVADNGVIGRNGDLPWRLSADLQRFKRLTMGHPIVMGRKTWESLGRPLPGRTSVVVTRQMDYGAAAEGVVVVHEFADALAAAQSAPGGDDEIFIIGGAELYRVAAPTAQRLYLTRVHAAVAGDALFPEYDAAAWRLVESERRAADEKNDYDLTFEIYERIAA